MNKTNNLILSIANACRDASARAQLLERLGYTAVIDPSSGLFHFKDSQGNEMRRDHANPFKAFKAVFTQSAIQDALVKETGINIGNINDLQTLLSLHTGSPEFDPLTYTDDSIQNTLKSPAYHFLANTQQMSEGLLACIVKEFRFPMLKGETEIETIQNLLSENNTSDFGKELKTIINGNDFVDLGCGPKEHCTVPRHIAQMYGARKYYGVDLHHVLNETLPCELPQFGNCELEFIRNDMLTFLKDFNKPAVFFISGIEPLIHSDEKALAYIDACLAEIQKAGGYLVIGTRGNVGFSPEKHGFVLASKGSAFSIYTAA